MDKTPVSIPTKVGVEASVHDKLVPTFVNLLGRNGVGDVGDVEELDDIGVEDVGFMFGESKLPLIPADNPRPRSVSGILHNFRFTLIKPDCVI